MQCHCDAGVYRHANAMASGNGRGNRFGLCSASCCAGHAGRHFSGRFAQAKNFFQGANAGARVFGGMGQKTEQKTTQVKGVRDE